MLKNKTLSNNSKLLLGIHTLYLMGSGISNIFLNIFIWKESNRLDLVVKFNIYFCLGVICTFILGGWLSKSKGLRINLILGMATYTLFYLFIFLFRNSIIYYVPLIGLIRGVGPGFYNVAFSVLGFDFSNENNREYFFGLQGVIGSVTSMATPLLSAKVITSFGGISGYTAIFISSFTIFLIGMIISFFIPNHHSKSRYHLVENSKLLIKNIDYSKAMLSESVKGTREIVMSFAVNILIFIISTKEMAVGNYSFWVSLSAIAASFASGLLINHNNRVKYLCWGTILTSAVSSIFIINLSMSSLWLFGIVTAISVIMIAIPQNTISLGVISSIPQSHSRRIESMVIKELFLNFGRLVSLFSILIFKININQIPVFIFLLGAVQILIWVLLKDCNSHAKNNIHIHPITLSLHKFSRLTY